MTTGEYYGPMSQAGFLQSFIEGLHFRKIEVFNSHCTENRKVERGRRRDSGRKTRAAGDDPGETTLTTNGEVIGQPGAA